MHISRLWFPVFIKVVMVALFITGCYKRPEYDRPKRSFLPGGQERSIEWGTEDTLSYLNVREGIRLRVMRKNMCRMLRDGTVRFDYQGYTSITPGTRSVKKMAPGIIGGSSVGVLAFWIDSTALAATLLGGVAVAVAVSLIFLAVPNSKMVKKVEKFKGIRWLGQPRACSPERPVAGIWVAITLKSGYKKVSFRRRSDRNGYILLSNQYINMAKWWARSCGSSLHLSASPRAGGSHYDRPPPLGDWIDHGEQAGAPVAGTFLSGKRGAVSLTLLSIASPYSRGRRRYGFSRRRNRRRISKRPIRKGPQSVWMNRVARPRRYRYRDTALNTMDSNRYSCQWAKYQAYLRRLTIEKAKHQVWHAAYSGDLNTLRRLIKKKIPLNVTLRGRTPLHVAIMRRMDNAAIMLINAGAVVDSRPGSTLALARRYGRTRIIRLVTRKKAIRGWLFGP